MSTDEEIDIIYDTIDGLLIDQKFTEIDSIIKQVDIKNTEIAVLLSYLTVTLPIRNILLYRKDFYEFIFYRFTYQDKFDSNKIYRLLFGLS